MALLISDKKILMTDWSGHLPLHNFDVFRRDKPKWSNDVILQADGDELDFIRSRFDNIPITKASICRWTGDIARFILDNL